MTDAHTSIPDSDLVAIVIERLVYKVVLGLAVFLQVVGLEWCTREVRKLPRHCLTADPLVDRNLPGIESIAEAALLGDPVKVHVARFVSSQVPPDQVQAQLVLSEHHQIGEI